MCQLILTISCRVNRPDGDDKDYGYIVDYMDLFRNIQTAVHDYTSEALDGYDKEDVEGLIKGRYDEAKSEMVGSLTSLKELLEQVPDPKADTDYIEYFCGSDGASDEKMARRDTLYALTAALTRSFSNCCDSWFPIMDTQSNRSHSCGAILTAITKSRT